MRASDFRAQFAPDQKRRKALPDFLEAKRIMRDHGRNADKEPTNKPKRVNAHRSQLEDDYAMHLSAECQFGPIDEWQYEAVRFHIGFAPSGRARWYTPDFMVVRSDGSVEFHETKGYDGGHMKVSIRAFEQAAERYPMFSWVIVRRERGMWTYEKVEAHHK